MSLLSGGGGDDRLQVGTATFVIVMSLVITMMIPLVAPAYDTDTGYSYADLYEQRAAVEAFTGESMTNMAPWKLDAVYTPWTIDKPVHIEKDTGWVYGDSIQYQRDGYMGRTEIGDTIQIYLDPDQKSDTPLVQYSDRVEVDTLVPDWWADAPFRDGLNLFGWAAAALGYNPFHHEMVPTDVNSWSYTGYRYSFDPMLKIDWDNPDAQPYSKASQLDAKLSIVWYKDTFSQGLSSGLILWNDKTHGIVANIESSDVVDRYNATSNYSSRYQLDFEGVKIYLNIRFDQNVIASVMDLSEAFDKGYWSMAITASSMDNFMDISSSNSLSSSAANLLETYSNIFHFDMPNVPFIWSMVLWIVCILHLEVVVMMFLSRFGIAGIGVGILGNVLLGVL